MTLQHCVKGFYNLTLCNFTKFCERIYSWDTVCSGPMSRNQLTANCKYWGKNHIWTEYIKVLCSCHFLDNVLE